MWTTTNHQRKQQGRTKPLVMWMRTSTQKWFSNSKQHRHQLLYQANTDNQRKYRASVDQSGGLGCDFGPADVQISHALTQTTCDSAGSCRFESEDALGRFHSAKNNKGRTNLDINRSTYWHLGYPPTPEVSRGNASQKWLREEYAARRRRRTEDEEQENGREREREETSTTCRSISGFALPSVTHNNQPLL